MGGVESVPKEANEDLIKQCTVLAMNSYKEQKTAPVGFEFVTTRRHDGNRADMYRHGNSLVIVFPGSETVGHWVHNSAEIIGPLSWFGESWH